MPHSTPRTLYGLVSTWGHGTDKRGLSRQSTRSLSNGQAQHMKFHSAFHDVNFRLQYSGLKTWGELWDARELWRSWGTKRPASHWEAATRRLWSEIREDDVCQVRLSRPGPSGLLFSSRSWPRADSVKLLITGLRGWLSSELFCSAVVGMNLHRGSLPSHRPAQIMNKAKRLLVQTKIKMSSSSSSSIMFYFAEFHQVFNISTGAAINSSCQGKILSL